MQALQAIAAIELVENPPRRRKVFRTRSDPFTLSDVKFKENYRFSKKSAKFIIDLVKQDLKQDPRGGATSPELQVLTALSYWGGRRVVSIVHHGLAQPTVSRICARVARAIAQHTSRYINMPQTIEEQQKVIREFAEIHGFSSVLGCVNCKHIKIKKYGALYPLNVQVVCDAKFRIRDIVVRWKNRNDDSPLYGKESTVRELFEREELKGRLLDEPEHPFRTLNDIYKERAALNCVEHCFDMWKQRFQVLLNGVTVHMHNITPTIVALAVLHNVALELEESVPSR